MAADHTASGRRVVGNISLSIEGGVTGPGGDMDMVWVARHAVTEAAREHMVRPTSTATTVLLGRNNYEGFGGYWPTVAADESDIIVQNSVSLIRQLLAADEIDRLTLTFCPEIVGGGTRLFEDGLTATTWTLTDLATADTGAMCLYYDRIRGDG